MFCHTRSSTPPQASWWRRELGGHGARLRHVEQVLRGGLGQVAAELALRNRLREAGGHLLRGRAPAQHAEGEPALHMRAAALNTCVFISVM